MNLRIPLHRQHISDGTNTSRMTWFFSGVEQALLGKVLPWDVSTTRLCIDNPRVLQSVCALGLPDQLSGLAYLPAPFHLYFTHPDRPTSLFAHELATPGSASGRRKLAVQRRQPLARLDDYPHVELGAEVLALCPGATNRLYLLCRRPKTGGYGFSIVVLIGSVDRGFTYGKEPVDYPIEMPLEWQRRIDADPSFSDRVTFHVEESVHLSATIFLSAPAAPHIATLHLQSDDDTLSALQPRPSLLNRVVPPNAAYPIHAASATRPSDRTPNTSQYLLLSDSSARFLCEAILGRPDEPRLRLVEPNDGAVRPQIDALTVLWLDVTATPPGPLPRSEAIRIVAMADSKNKCIWTLRDMIGQSGGSRLARLIGGGEVPLSNGAPANLQDSQLPRVDRVCAASDSCLIFGARGEVGWSALMTPKFLAALEGRHWDDKVKTHANQRSSSDYDS
jgi:hypothetical protein